MAKKADKMKALIMNEMEKAPVKNKSKKKMKKGC